MRVPHIMKLYCRRVFSALVLINTIHMAQNLVHTFAIRLWSNSFCDKFKFVCISHNLGESKIGMSDIVR